MAVFLPAIVRMSASPAHDAESCAVRLEPARHDALHPELDGWRSNVGSPVALDASARAASHLTGIDVLCWNIAIGSGRLEPVLERLRAEGIGDAADRPLVILVQEAFRADDSIPVSVGSAHHGGKVPLGERADIVELAHAHGLSLRYSPSMRNGTHPSDRGNAVLSTVQLADAHAFLLPYVRQRRVVVSARLAGHPAITFMSAHLDTHGRSREGDAGFRPGTGRAAQARALAATACALDGTVILGADLNSMFGMSDPGVRELVAAGMHPVRRSGSWRHTFHTPFRLLLDHVLYRCDAGTVMDADVVRLDEAPGDRTRGVYGSDHHPLLARFRFRH